MLRSVGRLDLGLGTLSNSSAASVFRPFLYRRHGNPAAGEEEVGPDELAASISPEEQGEAANCWARACLRHCQTQAGCRPLSLAWTLFTFRVGFLKI